MEGFRQNLDISTKAKPCPSQRIRHRTSSYTIRKGGGDMKRWLALIFLLAVCAAVVFYETSASERKYFLPEPLGGIKIVLDAGHGGMDGGASKGEVVEADITLEISKKLARQLTRLGAEVVETRTTAGDVIAEHTPSQQFDTMRERKRQDIFLRQAIIDEHEPDLFITVHANAIPDSQWRGAQVFYHKKGEPKSELLAKSVQEAIRTELENTEREALGIEKIYLLKKTKVPAILVETGFISNDEERQLLTEDKYQQKMARAIADGVENYIHSEIQ